MHAEAKLLPDRSVAIRWAFAFGMTAAALFVVVAVQSLGWKGPDDDHTNRPVEK